MTRKFSIFRPMNLKRPPSPTKPQLIAVLQQRERKPPAPPIPPGMIDATWTQWESQNLDWGQLDLRDATANIYFMIPV